MKVFQVSFFLLAIVVVTALAGKPEDDEWEAYKKNHGKNPKDAKEEERRKGNFLKTNEKVKAHNSKKDRTFDMVHNQFSDWDEAEKSKLTGAKVAVKTVRGSNRASFEDVEDVDMRQVPTTLDYRNNSCLPAVKNQGQCGSCWAFAAMTPLEFATCNKSTSKTAISLSEQQLVDCVQYGCSGGWYETAWAYLKNRGTLATSAYSYKAVMTGTCPAVTTSVTKPVSWGPATSTGAPGIMASLAKYGPLAVALHVVSDFYNFGSGVYSSTVCTQTTVNHAVVIVGYGTLNGIDYWIVRNSWGPYWGMKGYFLIKRGVNMCNIENYTRFVTV